MRPWLDWYYWTIVPLWLVWFGYWMLAGRAVKRDQSAEPTGSRFLHLLFLVLAFALIANLPAGALLATTFLPHRIGVFAAGLALALLGFGISVWARLTLGANWSGRVTIKDDHQLITSGPYKLIRHPIYTGIITAVLGSAIALDKLQGLLSFVIVLVIYLRKLRIEERALLLHFNDAYEQYKRRSYALFPYLY